MIDTEKYQPARQNMKLVTRSLRSLATKFHILARQADIFGINQFTSRYHIHILCRLQVTITEIVIVRHWFRESEHARFSSPISQTGNKGFGQTSYIYSDVVTISNIHIEIVWLRIDLNVHVLAYFTWWNYNHHENRMHNVVYCHVCG